MEFKEFESWINKFIEKHGGFSPNHLNNFFKNVENSHTEIRSLIGKDVIDRCISLKEQQRESKGEDFDNCVEQIIKIIPNYLRDYDYTKDIFKYPTIPIGTHKITRTAKHIQSYFESMRQDDSGYENKIAEIRILLAKLGTFWSQARNSAIDLNITLSTTPRAFVLLGHYGSDIDSCFKQNGSSERDKYSLAQSNNTFVITIDKKIDNEYKNVARAFGFLSGNKECFNLSNYYFSNNFQEGDALEAFTIFFSDILKEQVTIVNKKTSLGSGIFINEYGNWSFVNSKNTQISTQKLYPNHDNIKIFNCKRCGKDYSNDSSWKEIDGLLLCDRCTSYANRCEETDQYTFFPLIEVIMSNGLIGMVSTALNEKIKECLTCGEKFLSKDKELHCFDCIGDFVDCDNCYTLVKSDDVITVDDIDYCLNCKDEIDYGT